jgi:hypothetical protein
VAEQRGQVCFERARQRVVVDHEQAYGRGGWKFGAGVGHGDFSM